MKKERVINNKKPFDEAALNTAWKNYTHALEQKNEKYKASILTTTTPKIRENKVEYFVTNKIALEKARAETENLQWYLREFLKNDTIEVLIQFDENITPIKKVPYTSKENYENILEENPDIAYLKQTFDLVFI